MTVGWTVFEILINIYQAVIYLLFLKKCVPITRSSRLADCLCVVACAGFLTLYLFFDIPFTDSFNVIIYFLYLRYVSNERWYVLGIWTIVKEVIVVATVGLMLALSRTLTSATHEMLMEPGALRLLFVASTNLVLFLVFFIFSRRIQRNGSPLAVPALLFFLGINISIFFAIEMLFSIQILSFSDTDWHIFAAYGGMIACSILSVFLYHMMTDVVHKQNQSQMALNHAQLTRQHQLELTDIYQETIAHQHDFKHQMQTLEQLVAQGDAQAAKEYLDEYRKKIQSTQRYITGSIPVDALLASKSPAYKQHHISFYLEPYPLSDLPIDEVDFCTIVGNLLDNAIEGVNRIQNKHTKRVIRLSFHRIWDTFIIRCENNMEPGTLRRQAAVFLSSKTKDAAIHGFGIRNIELIAQNADGFCTFETQGHTFIATVTLPYPLPKEDETCGN